VTILLVNEPAIEEPQPGDMNIFFRNHRLIRNRAKRMESKNDAAVTSNATAGSGSAVPKRTYYKRKNKNKNKKNRAFSPKLTRSKINDKSI